MALFPRLFRKASPNAAEKSYAGIPTPFLPSLGTTYSSSGAPVGIVTALSNPAVLACVSRRSKDVARCRPSLYRISPKGAREIVKDHPVSKLFRKPNEIQTWFEFCEQMGASLYLRGNAYAVILRDAKGKPTQLIPVSPDLVTVLEAEDGSIFYTVSRSGLWQLAVLRNLPLSIPSEDVLHLRGVSLGSTYGINSLLLARDTIGLSLSLDEQASSWLKNGARPSGVLQVAKTLTKEAGERLASSWRSLFTGSSKVGAVAVLEDGVEFKQMSMTSQDLQLLEQNKFQVEQICRLFGVPPYKIGVPGAVSQTNMIQADQTYVNETIAPDLDRWEQKIIQCFDLEEQELSVDFDESSLLRADVLTRMNIGRMGTMSGLYATNEWREAEGLCPIEDLPKGPGWEVRAPVNLAALGSDMTGTAPDGAGRPRSGQEDVVAQ